MFVIFVVLLSSLRNSPTQNLPPSAVNVSSNENSGVRAFVRDPSAPILVENGKIVIIYVGSEECPFCAVEHWAIYEALKNFGTWSGIKETYAHTHLGNIPTISFLNATYTSDKIVFMFYMYGEGSMNQVVKSIYAKYGNNYVPFLSIGGAYYKIGTNINPALFLNLTPHDVEEQLQTKNGTIYREIQKETQLLTITINTALAETETNTISQAQKSISQAISQAQDDLRLFTRLTITEALDIIKDRSNIPYLYSAFLFVEKACL
jgi:hypothetical protein